MKNITSSFKQVFLSLEQAIGITNKRHSIIANNISNLDTSNYRPKDVDFKEALSGALKQKSGSAMVKTDPAHMPYKGDPGSRPVFEDKGEWNGYNWVNVDREMKRLMENNLMHRTAVELLLRKISTLREVIKEGGR